MKRFASWQFYITLLLSIGAVLNCGFASAQQAADLKHQYRIGWLGSGTQAISGRYLETFLQAMRGFGHVEGNDIALETLYADGDYGRLPGIAKELVARKVDLILVGNERALVAAKQTLAPIPIVAVACDPLEKFVGSLSRPGGNATGFTCASSALVGKRFGYLKALMPNLKRVAYFYNAEDDVEAEFRSAEVAGKTLGMAPIRFPVRSREEIAAAFKAMARQHCQALYVSVSAFTNNHRYRIAELALGHHLPSINGFPEYPEAGGLISYGATLEDGFKRAAHFVDRIMHGASPRDLPVEEPTRFYLVVNAKTAKELKIRIPESILTQANTVLN